MPAKMRVRDLFAFIQERYVIYARRAQGQPKPWTQDPILQQYRFCNVYRELDTVTQWIAKNWRAPHYANPDLWFAMAVARLVNWPDSLAEIAPALISPAAPAQMRRASIHWDPKLFTLLMDARKARKEKLFTGAYMIHADAVHSGTKAAYLAERVLTPMWEAREYIRPGKGDTLATFHRRLMEYRDMGSFMAGQIVADVKYTPPLVAASDWWMWAAMGPGSARGLNRVYARSPQEPWDSEDDWFAHLHALHTQVNILTLRHRLPDLHAQDLQNCLCEWDKYERVRLGEGRPRSLYPGK